MSKFTFALIAGILLVHAVSAAVLVWRERRMITLDMSRHARVLGRTLGYAVERAWKSSGEAQALEIIQHATEQESHVHLRWVWLQGKPRALHAPVASAKVLAPLARGQSVAVRLGGAEETLYTYVPVRVPSSRAGAIEIADPLSDAQDHLQDSIIDAAISAVTLAVLSSLLTVLLGVHFIGRPVRRLVEHARAVGRGDLGARLALPARDELGTLAAEMDRMTDQLQQAREQLEQEARQRVTATEQLRHADRLTSVGRLASGIAHELGTPINVIEGHAQLVREDPRSNDDARDHVQVIARQCKRMTGIIRQLLDFARRGGGGDVTVADAREAVRETLRMVRPLLHKQSIEATLDDGGAALVAVSFSQLQHVLLNLVVNAIHAMPRGGTLGLRVEHRRATGSASIQESAHVVIAVEDTGEGMDSETVKRVFEPFFTTKDVGEGTGLGLSVAFGIIKDHDGWVEVQSAPGRGSTFTVFLPAESAA